MALLLAQSPFCNNAAVAAATLPPFAEYALKYLSAEKPLRTKSVSRIYQLWHISGDENRYFISIPSI